AGGMRFGISQAEVTNFGHLADYLEKLRTALVELADSRGLDFVMLMVTDVVRRTSRLLITKEIPALDVLPFPHLSDGTFNAVDVVSRKKQLLPVVLGALEG
ncbi:MAG: hypothetical protein KDE48_03495, partial [Anaerolineales bacterium]|nr:hypothetical protein [Anaerolineales bacterium]